MSNQHRKAPLIEEIAARMQALQEATSALDDVAARRLGLNETDLRLLSILERRGPMTVGALTAEAGLSKPAMTAAVDRLVRKGYARREATAGDRRSSTVVMTGPAREAVAAIYGPLAAEGYALLRRYPLRDLRAIARFLEASEDLQRRHAARVREGRGPD